MTSLAHLDDKGCGAGFLARGVMVVILGAMALTSPALAQDAPAADAPIKVILDTDMVELFNDWDVDADAGPRPEYRSFGGDGPVWKHADAGRRGCGGAPA